MPRPLPSPVSGAFWRSLPSFSLVGFRSGSRVALSHVAGVTGLPRASLFWGVDSPGCVWCLDADGCAVLVASTREGAGWFR